MRKKRSLYVIPSASSSKISLIKTTLSYNRPSLMIIMKLCRLGFVSHMIISYCCCLAEL